MPVCAVVQHVEPEGPYRIADALKAHDVEVDLCRLFAGDDLPVIAAGCDGLAGGCDGLVVMGGPMSAASDQRFPTLQAELSLLRDAMDNDVPVLGVCLGAQLLAVAAGGHVYRGANGPEIGWAPITLTPRARTDPLFAGVDSPLTVLHWHGDTFDLPPCAERLAGSNVYPNQAFRVGRQAWGLQFHLEVDASALSAFVGAFGHEAMDANVAPHDIEHPAQGTQDRLARTSDVVLGRFAAIVACRKASIPPFGPGEEGPRPQS